MLENVGVIFLCRHDKELAVNGTRLHNTYGIYILYTFPKDINTIG
jgi:hypothetical protein